ncbi:hypothetical protein F4859DRAFT_523697 [Xylaria cf. heliscus]|nr:hypothetical protein F4859DRAFT_523697 [Xylaria cf. heliscus]
MSEFMAAEELKGLTSLPGELLCSIGAMLPRSDHCSLRLTCRTIEMKLFVPFARKYFSHFQVMRTDFSLQTLADIAASRVAPFLKQVILATELLETEFENLTMFINRDKDMTMSRTRANASKLLEIRDYPQPRFPVRRRRPHHPLRCTNYGFSTFMTKSCLPTAATQFLPRRGATEEDVSAFQMILSAAGRAHAAPRTLSTIINRDIGLQSMAFQLPAAVGETVWPVVSKLEEIHLEINGGQSTQSLVNFLSHAKRLRILSLNFVVSNELHGEIFNWLASVNSFQSPYNPEAQAIGLCQLDLQNATIPVETMISISSNFNYTLTTLALSEINLAATIADLEDNSPGIQQRPWDKFLESLTLFDSRLDTICICMPIDCASTSRTVVQRRNFSVRNSLYQSVSYSGPSVCEVLEGLSLSLKPNSPWEPDVEGKLQFSGDVFY